MTADSFLAVASDIETARMQLIEKMLRKELIDDWTGRWYQEKWGVLDRFLLKEGQVQDLPLRFDSGKYHPDDKNFGYYHRLIPELKGFFGSPNLRHSGMVNSCAFSPDGRQILSGSRDNTLKLWDTENGKTIRTFTGHTSWVSSCAFSPDGRQILSGSHDNTLKLWDTESGKEIRTFTGHTSNVNSCAFSPDGRQILSGSWDNTLKLWDTESGNELQSIALLWTPLAISVCRCNQPHEWGYYGHEFITANANCTLTLFAVIPNNCKESGNPLLKGVDA